MYYILHSVLLPDVLPIIILMEAVALVLVRKLSSFWNIIRKSELIQKFPIPKYCYVRKTMAVCSFVHLWDVLPYVRGLLEIHVPWKVIQPDGVLYIIRQQIRISIKKTFHRNNISIIIWILRCINNNTLEHLLHVNIIYGCRRKKMIQFLRDSTMIIISLSRGHPNVTLQQNWCTRITCRWGCVSYGRINSSTTCGRNHIS